MVNNMLNDYRMECNVESVIKHDNNLTVCLLMNTDNAELLANVERSSQSLLTYHNATSQLLVMPMDLNAIFLNTPIFRWWQEELQYTLSRWKINHLSDAARLAFLWKYGGMYLDHGKRRNTQLGRIFLLKNLQLKKVSVFLSRCDGVEIYQQPE